MPPTQVGQIVLTNQFGEESINQIQLEGSETGLAGIVSDAAPSAVTGALLTGLAAGAATTILATDTVLEALAKIQAQIDAL